MQEPVWKPLLLQLLIPGLGHFYLRERLFSIFIFLVMLLAALLFAASFFLSLPMAVRVVMLGLPVLFYLFSFVELVRLSKAAVHKKQTAPKKYSYFLIAGLVYQLVAPVAIGNFLIVNRPEIFPLETTGFAPELTKGTLLIANNMKYQVRFMVLQKVIFHSLPERFEIVRVEDANGDRHTGMVVGLPQEEIEIIAGVVVVDGTPELLDSKAERLTAGNWPLTKAGDYAILVALMGTGKIDTLLQIPLDATMGSVRPLL